MNENRLRELMHDSVDGVEASETLRATVSDAVGRRRQRRRAATRGWIAVGGAGLAAAAVLLVVPLVRPPSSAPPGPAAGATSTGVTPVDDAEDVLGGDTWYGVGIVAHGRSLAIRTPKRAEDAMHIKLSGNGLNGYDGCHWFYAARSLLVSAPSNTVAITMTANACLPDPVGSQEFYDAVSSGPKSWVIDGGLLVLTSEGIEVSFSKDPNARPPSSATVLSSRQDVLALLGTKTWYAVGILASGSPIELFKPSDRNRAMRIKVESAGVTGFDGCNWIGATTAALSSAPTTRVDWSNTDVGCSPFPAGQAEFVSALHESAKMWAMTSSNLVLTTSSYEITFSTIPPAPGAAASSTR